MKSFMRYFLVIVCVVALVGSTATAQDLQQQLAKLGHDAAVGYVTPLLSGWGNDLNSAIYYSADLHGVLGFDVGVKFAMSKFTDADKTYSLSLPSMKLTSFPGVTIPAGNYLKLTAGTNYPATITANSAVGAKDEVNVKTLVGNAPIYNSANQQVGTVPLPADQVILTLPGGFDIGKLGVPMVMPQFNLGLPLGLEVMLRYVPTISASDAGKFNYMGFGLRYDIDQWLPLCPVDLAVHFMTQKMNFKSKSDNDIFSARAVAYGAEVSKKFLILTLYGGLQLESSTLTLADFQGYSPELGQQVTVSGFEVKGSDKSRFTVGARLLLLIVNVQVEYSIAKNPVLALGLGISFR
jgi:hypothetical protein